MGLAGQTRYICTDIVHVHAVRVYTYVHLVLLLISYKLGLTYIIT